MNYITVIIDPEKMNVGGIAQIMNDVLSAYILSHLLDNYTYAHYPILSLTDDFYRDTDPEKYTNTKYHDTQTNWEELLQFGKNEVPYDQVKHMNLVHVNIVESFTTFTLDQFQRRYESYENTLFVLTNNNRIYLNEIRTTNPQAYNLISNKLFRKLKHLKIVKHSTIPITIGMHIRRGDWDTQPIEYNIRMIQLFQKHLELPFKIYVYAIGDQTQLKKIRYALNATKADIEFRFNTNVFDTFQELYNADIIIGGHSCFPKIIAMFSKNILFYIPFNDGIIDVSHENVAKQVHQWGRAAEEWDTHRMIMTDIYCKLNRNIILSILNKFH
jgi:hypothetical protein